jgi:hypothetical protein
MRHSEFQQWLRNLPTISLAPERDALARSKRVEKFEGDLDEHFANDRMAALLARLTYSREDERSGREPRHSITFSTDANIREGTAALAGAVRLYLRFRDDVSDSTDPLPPRPSAPVSVVPGPRGYPIGDGEETLSLDTVLTKRDLAAKFARCARTWERAYQHSGSEALGKASSPSQ